MSTDNKDTDNEAWEPRPKYEGMSLREFRLRAKIAKSANDMESLLKELKVSILTEVNYGAKNRFVVLYRDEAEKAIEKHRERIEAEKAAIEQAKRNKEETDKNKQKASQWDLLQEALKDNPSMKDSVEALIASELSKQSTK